MPKRFFLSIVFLGVGLAFLSACVNQNRDITSEAKAILEKLNRWAVIEIGTIECPEDYPGHIAPGEMRAQISDQKKELNKLGVEARWNCAKKLYEIVAVGQTSSPVCGCQQ